MQQGFRMDQHSEHYETCPSVEDLSAWHDSELRDRAMEEHVATCTNCLKVIQSFHVIDTRVVETVKLDTHALCRIKTRARREVQTRPFAVGLRVVARTAAMVGLVAGVIYIRNHIAKLERAERLADATPVPSPGSTGMIPMSPGLAATESADAQVAPVQRRLAASMSTGGQAAPVAPVAMTGTAVAPHAVMAPTDVHRDDVNFANVYTVSTASRRPVPNFNGAGINTTTVSNSNSNMPGMVYPVVQQIEPIELADQVRHVWLVDNAHEAVNELSQFMPDDDQQFKKMLDSTQPQFVIQMRLPDRDLAVLVDHFHELGYNLMSPDAPQPESTGATHFTGKKVAYEMNIIAK